MFPKIIEMFAPRSVIRSHCGSRFASRCFYSTLLLRPRHHFCSTSPMPFGRSGRSASSLFNEDDRADREFQGLRGNAYKGQRSKAYVANFLRHTGSMTDDVEAIIDYTKFWLMVVKDHNHNKAMKADISAFREQVTKTAASIESLVNTMLNHRAQAEVDARWESVDQWKKYLAEVAPDLVYGSPGRPPSAAASSCGAPTAHAARGDRPSFPASDVADVIWRESGGTTNWAAPAAAAATASVGPTADDVTWGLVLRALGAIERLASIRRGRWGPRRGAPPSLPPERRPPSAEEVGAPPHGIRDGADPRMGAAGAYSCFHANFVRDLFPSGPASTSTFAAFGVAVAVDEIRAIPREHRCPEMATVDNTLAAARRFHGDLCAADGSRWDVARFLTHLTLAAAPNDPTWIVIVMAFRKVSAALGAQTAERDGHCSSDSDAPIRDLFAEDDHWLTEAAR